MDEETQHAIVVPHMGLSLEALRALVEHFVLREGTDYGERECSLDEKVEQVMEQLRRGQAHILFDTETESVTIVLAEQCPASASTPLP